MSVVSRNESLAAVMMLSGIEPIGSGDSAKVRSSSYTPNVMPGSVDIPNMILFDVWAGNEGSCRTGEHIYINC